MGTVAEWNTEQQNAAIAWRDAELVANPSITDQQMLDALNLEPVIGHWSILETVNIEQGRIDLVQAEKDIQDSAGILITDDLAAVFSKLNSEISNAQEAFCGAIYLLTWQRLGFISSVPTTEEISTIPTLTLSDITDLRNL